jgi:hypothetical protein
MGILIPIMAYAGAVLLVEENLRQGWLPVPFEMAQPVTIPMFGSFPYLYAYLLVATVLTVLGFGVFIIFYSFIYRVAGPSQYGPMDAPPGDYRFPTSRRGSGKR